jgi:hypothetical protein
MRFAKKASRFAAMPSRLLLKMRKAIITNHIFPPIPLRQFDWSAVRDGYEPGDNQGFGKTEPEAIGDLLELEADDERCGCCDAEGSRALGDDGREFCSECQTVWR